MKSYFFGLDTLKGIIKAPAVDVLWLNTLRGAKTTCLTPKRYDQHPCFFYTGVPHRGLCSRYDFRVMLYVLQKLEAEIIENDMIMER